MREKTKIIRRNVIFHTLNLPKFLNMLHMYIFQSCKRATSSILVF